MTTHEFRNCRYCADKVDVVWLPRHEQDCKTRTPQGREAAKTLRIAARQRYRRTHHLRVPVVRTRGYQRHNVWANGGRRLSATISIDFESFRALLLQMAPLLSIDKVEVL